VHDRVRRVSRRAPPLWLPPRPAAFATVPRILLPPARASLSHSRRAVHAPVLPAFAAGEKPLATTLERTDIRLFSYMESLVNLLFPRAYKPLFTTRNKTRIRPLSTMNPVVTLDITLRPEAFSAAFNRTNKQFFLAVDEQMHAHVAAERKALSTTLKRTDIRLFSGMDSPVNLLFPKVCKPLSTTLDKTRIRPLITMNPVVALDISLLPEAFSAVSNRTSKRFFLAVNEQMCPHSSGGSKALLTTLNRAEDMALFSAVRPQMRPQTDNCRKPSPAPLKGADTGLLLRMRPQMGAHTTGSGRLSCTSLKGTDSAHRPSGMRAQRLAADSGAWQLLCTTRRRAEIRLAPGTDTMPFNPGFDLTCTLAASLSPKSTRRLPYSLSRVPPSGCHSRPALLVPLSLAQAPLSQAQAPLPQAQAPLPQAQAPGTTAGPPARKQFARQHKFRRKTHATAALHRHLQRRVWQAARLCDSFGMSNRRIHGTCTPQARQAPGWTLLWHQGSGLMTPLSRLSSGAVHSPAAPDGPARLIQAGCCPEADAPMHPPLSRLTGLRQPCQLGDRAAEITDGREHGRYQHRTGRNDTTSDPCHDSLFRCRQQSCGATPLWKDTLSRHPDAADSAGLTYAILCRTGPGLFPV